MTKSLRELAFSEVLNLLQRGVSIFKPNDPVSTVLGELEKINRYEAVVSDGNKVGLVTPRYLLDVTQPTQTTIKNYWAITGSASPSDTIIDVTEILIRDNFRAVPIIDNREIIGIISQVDVMEALCDVQELSSISPSRIMRGPVVSLDVKEKVALARSIMLDKGFSHIPIVENDSLVGMVTAKIMVNAFIIPMGVPTTGERVGEKVARFIGSVGNIMDTHPLTVGPDSSALEVARLMRDHHKSACVVLDDEGSIIGIITPRELLALLMRFKKKEELPIYILGLSEEDFFDRTWAEEKARRVVERGLKIHPHINEISITIKKSRAKGNRIRYEMTAQVFSLNRDEMFSVKTEGWGLLQVFNGLCKTLDKELRKSKHKPRRGPSIRKM